MLGLELESNYGKVRFMVRVRGMNKVNVSVRTRVRVRVRTRVGVRVIYRGTKRVRIRVWV